MVIRPIDKLSGVVVEIKGRRPGDIPRFLAGLKTFIVFFHEAILINKSLIKLQARAICDVANGVHHSVVGSWDRFVRLICLYDMRDSPSGSR